MFELFKRFLKEEEGQDLVEYALLLVFRGITKRCVNEARAV